MSPKNAIKMINIQKYNLVHIGPIWLTLVHFAHFGSIRSTLSYSVLVLFSRHWSYLFLLSSHWSTLSYSVHFGPSRSSLFSFGPILSIQSTLFHLVHLCSLQSIQITLIHLCSLRSILIYFSPFLYTCIQREDMFRLRVPILNSNIYIYISNS